MGDRRIIHASRPAMATLFELWLSGDDDQHLAAVGDAALGEIARIERLLSRFDPTSELSRLNRDARRESVLVDPELLGVLRNCREVHEATGGAFDPARASGEARRGEGFSRLVAIDEDRRRVRFRRPYVALDLGGYGKGYALEAAAAVLRRFGVSDALLHGGTSSVLALGTRANGEPWEVRIPDSAGDPAGTGGAMTTLRLRDEGLSTSAVFSGEDAASDAPSDIVDPIRGERLRDPSRCTVVADTALEAEVLSTAALAMGRRRAEALIESLRRDRGGGRTPEMLWREGSRARAMGDRRRRCF